MADLLGRATGQFGGAALVQQNILVQVLSIPKIGESLVDRDAVIEATAVTSGAAPLDDASRTSALVE